jgi:formylglycine-generating enzyme required for sulfatase activity
MSTRLRGAPGAILVVAALALPSAAVTGDLMALRRGWGNNPYCLRAAYRDGNPPHIGLDMVGFRCAGDAR